MIAYQYDQDGYFVGVISCQKNPIKKSEYLLPVNSTFVQPPTGYTEDKIPVFNNDLGQWVLVSSPLKIQENLNLLKLTNEFGVSLYFSDDEGNAVLRSVEDVEAESNIIKKQRDIDFLKNQMDFKIFQKAQEVTKGSSMESIQAFVSSYQLRSSNASEYVNDGLKAHYTYGNFAQGDLLDTETKIQEYYKSLLILLDKFRETEINNYLIAKAAL